MQFQEQRQIPAGTQKQTGEGLAGWGEPTLEGKALVVEAAVKAFAEILIGEDPLRTVFLRCLPSWKRYR